MAAFKNRDEAISYFKAHLVVKHATKNGAYTCGRTIKPEGDVNHSVGCAQPAADVFFNLMNDSGAQWGVNYILGDFHKGEGRVLEVLKPTSRPWGCASGKNGSWNNSRVQWEVCEPAGHTYAGGTMVNYDASKNATYFNRMWKMLVAINVYVAVTYGFNPDKIADHAESYKAGYGSNHSDMGHWLPKHGKSMAALRAEVKEILNATSGSANSTAPSNAVKPTTKAAAIAKGDVVKIATGAKYYTGKAVPSWVIEKQWVVKEIDGERAVIDKSSDGKNSICSPISTKYLTVSKKAASTFKSYAVRVTASALNIRKGPGTNYAVCGQIKDKGIYTIVSESPDKRWGKLKSGAGWIYLDYTKKV